MAVKFLLAAIFFLLFPAKVFAAFTIEQVSPSEITSADQELTLFVSATNLSSQTQYFQAAITREGKSNYFGQTQGSSGTWTKYTSSPDFSTLVAFTPTNGGWNGEIKVKLDTADSGFTGSGTYQIKLLKYITSSGTSSDAVPITVNIPTSSQPEVTSPTATTVVSPTEVPKATPNIQFTLPQNLKTGEEFDLNFSLTNFDPGSYYFKVRIGRDTSHLTLGQTFSSVWLTDTDAWSKFPTITSGSKLKVRLSPEAAPGSYVVRVRLKRTDSDKTFDSEDKTVYFSEGQKLATPTKTQTSKASPTPTKTPTPQSLKSGVVLAAAASASTLAAEINQTLKTKDLLATHTSLALVNSSKSASLRLRLREQLDNHWPLIGGLTMLGFLLFSTGLGWFLKKRYL